MMLRAALGFFTRLPIGSAPLPPTFRGVAVWLPVVGLIIGLLISLALGLAAQILPASLCGVIGCLAWVAVTGGLHLDGVADCGDGLIVEAPPARRLEIMKDSRLGTFGGAALFFILALKAAALGATSFLLHETYVPAVRFAAERCDDVALLLVEPGERNEYLATPGEIAEIGRIIAGEGVTLHVHLPTDADFDTREGARAMIGKIRRVAELTGPLAPHSFVLHVDFPSLHGTGGEPSAEQQEWTAEALREIAACLPAPERLAVENLETYPPTFWDRWLAGTPYSRCLDVGHIWKDSGDPAPVLAAWLPRVRVIHLHGLEPRGSEADAAKPQGQQGAPEKQAERNLARLFGPRPRDHKSLRLMPPEFVDDVMHPLWKTGFSGVLNLEVFSVEDFTASHAVLMQSWERYAASS